MLREIGNHGIPNYDILVLDTEFTQMCGNILYTGFAEGLVDLSCTGSCVG